MTGGHTRRSPFTKNSETVYFEIIQLLTPYKGNYTHLIVQDILQRKDTLGYHCYTDTEFTEEVEQIIYNLLRWGVLNSINGVLFSSGEIPVGGDIGEYLKYYQQLDDEGD
jgi:hypothetical protein